MLGEANVRNLRGENILDVIFKGSGSAKPSGFAEVNLLVDNEDRALPVETAEVSIARRVYPLGRQRVPDQRPRLPTEGHPQSLPRDGARQPAATRSSSGRWSTRSLSDHDDQRRLFFEEAAGISRYKLQRREAMRKLEATEQDLMRIDDIVREIEREVRRLARQVGKARSATSV